MSTCYPSLPTFKGPPVPSFVQVAEKLANEAVKSNRQVQIVEYGGLKLLVPLTKSKDQEVQRLAAHALANLSVNGMQSYASVRKLLHI